MPVNAGAKTAPPTPYSATSTIACQSSSVPVTDRTPSAAMAVPRIASETMSTSRRSNRSLTTPPSRSSSTCGAIQATPTSANAVGALEIE